MITTLIVWSRGLGGFTRSQAFLIDGLFSQVLAAETVVEATSARGRGWIFSRRFRGGLRR